MSNTRLPVAEKEIDPVAFTNHQDQAQSTGDLSPKAGNRARDQLTMSQKLDELKAEFLGFVSHEMGTPLTVIEGALYTLLADQNMLSETERRGLLEDALSESESLANTVGNLLELARARANHLELAMARVNLPQIIEPVVERMKRRNTGHSFLIDCPVTSRVMADRVRLERVLHNLVDNAIKYSPAGSAVKVLGAESGNMVVVGVRDEGPGIPAPDRARIFDVFQRAGAGSPVRGIGLGLPVSQKLIEAQGGKLWVESAPGDGSTFYFTLPAAVTSPSPP